MTTILEILFYVGIAFVVIGGGWLYREMKRTPVSTKSWEPGDE